MRQASPAQHGKLPGVREIHPDEYVITSEPTPRTPLGRLWRWARVVVLGSPIPTKAEKHERLSIFTGIAILGADNISSSVYGPEEMMRALAFAGTGALMLGRPIAAGIVALFILLAISYQQTIRAYPSGAGGYIVASANLGALLGVISAAALIVDYSLDVAVSISSGVQSITSAISSLANARVAVALAVLAIMMLANLRGIRTSGALFALPIYLYIAGALGVLVIGLVRWAAGDLPSYQPPAAAAAQLSAPTAAVGLLLIIRAFASGAVALTGIEAVSNGIPYFKPPEADNARRTLMVMACTFAALFLGLSVLAAQLKVVPDPNEVETIVSQLTRTFMGRGPYYYVMQAATFLVLILAADTGFADFPRLLSLLARDRYLPEQFAFRGRRLAFSNGIVLVSVVSGVLMFVFKASVAGLVPLFAIGAFTTFTLSQAGMARHWWRKRDTNWPVHLAINATGAIATGAVLAVEIAAKFTEGAWAVLLLMPILVLGLTAAGGHLQRAHRAVAVRSRSQIEDTFHHHTLIPVNDLNKASLHAIAYARSVCAGKPAASSCAQRTPLAQAVFVTDDEDEAQKLQARWRRVDPGVPLTILESPYRALVPTILRYVDELQAEHRPRRCMVTVVIPEIVPVYPWQRFLHYTIALRLRSALLFRTDTAVTSAPYRLRR